MRSTTGPSALFAAAALWCTALIGPAGASPLPALVGPPPIDQGALVLNAPVAPPEPSEQRQLCSHPNWTGPPLPGQPAMQQALDLPAAWQFGTGLGQLVAVIDTGVNRHPRLRHLFGGGDYVDNSDGTVDCDGHGTLVAGIIAAAPNPNDGFAGVAPDAAVLSIRQTSLAYEVKGAASNQAPGAMSAGGYGTVVSLAYAVVHAVQMHATVINISEVSCSSAGDRQADGQLGAALKYAYDQNVVVVVAAGNLDDSLCKDQNDATGWGAVRTVATPAWFTPYVLSVASVDQNGMPSSFSIHGPWIGVAAPGTNLVSLDSTPGGTGLVNGNPAADGSVSPIDGTSFSSAYVAGLAALVRQRFPQLNAGQVIDRIERTAHAPGTGRDDAIGAGMIDPQAALTAQLPDRSVSQNTGIGRPIAAPPLAAAVDPWPRRIAVVGTMGCLAALAIGMAVSVPFRRGRRKQQLAEDLGEW